MFLILLLVSLAVSQQDSSFFSRFKRGYSEEMDARQERFNQNMGLAKSYREEMSGRLQDAQGNERERLERIVKSADSYMNPSLAQRFMSRFKARASAVKVGFDNAVNRQKPGFLSRFRQGWSNQRKTTQERYDQNMDLAKSYREEMSGRLQDAQQGDEQKRLERIVKSADSYMNPSFGRRVKTGLKSRTAAFKAGVNNAFNRPGFISRFRKGWSGEMRTAQQRRDRNMRVASSYREEMAGRYQDARGRADRKHYQTILKSIDNYQNPSVAQRFRNGFQTRANAFRAGVARAFRR